MSQEARAAAIIFFYFRARFRLFLKRLSFLLYGSFTYVPEGFSIIFFPYLLDAKGAYTNLLQEKNNPLSFYQKLRPEPQGALPQEVILKNR